jgi:phosphatidylethanolamine/phosphatidyl-N-methylethanolamine N-methyltransferase
VQHGQRSENVKLSDNMSFLRTWMERPSVVGAVSPSGPALARAMASYVDLSREGPIVELGPGTGPVTKALLARGVPAERLVLVEYEKKFCRLLAERYPSVKIVQGDAYALKKTLQGHLDGRVATIVSSLPLLMRPEHDRVDLMHQAFELMGPDGLFIQFTYHLTISPVPLRANGSAAAFVGKATAPILLNFPPARVWRYRAAGHAGAPGR